MYMPGRNRTGSRPSKTVMSFAVYEASVITKALQIAHFRAAVSVSERAVVRVFRGRSREARAGRSRDQLAELRVLDRGRPLGRVARLLQGSLGTRFERGVRTLRRRFRKRSRRELELRLRRQPRRDLRRTLRELEPPHGVARVHEQRAVAREARGPRVSRDLRADCSGPCSDGVADAALRTETSELVLQLVADRLHHAASR